MPKSSKPRFYIHLDLLKPQSNSQNISVTLMHWLLQTGRFIFVFVEALVLIAFAARFKFDADLASKKEAIEQQIPYIESLRPFEILIRQTQLKLSTINSFRKNYIDYDQILKKIADQTPAGVKIISLNLERSVAIITIHLNAQAQTNNDLTNFVNGLKQDPLFTDINVVSLGLEKGSITFSLNAQTNSTSKGGKSS